MAARLGPVDAVAASPAYSGRAWRQTMLGPVLGGATAARPLGAQSGVRPGTAQTIATATSTTWTVTPFAGIADVETAAEAGAYGFAFDTNQTGSVNAAHATWPRWDILSVQIDDPGEADGTATPASRVLYTAGTAASSPAEPAVPARAMRICRIVVPQSGGGSPSVVWEAPVMASAGGLYLNPPTDQKTALNAIATATNPVWIDDAGVLKRSVGSGFVAITFTDATDTGWVAFTPSAGWIAKSTLQTRRVGRHVWIRGLLQPDSGTIAASSSPNVAIVPAGIRPVADHHEPACAWVFGGTPQYGGGSCALNITASTGQMTLTVSSFSALTGVVVDNCGWDLD